MATRSKSASPEQTRQQTLLALLGIIVLMLASWWLYLWWSKPPVVQYDNLRFIQLLRTACSSQRLDYLEGVQKAVQARRDEQKMNDGEWNHFQTIIGMAKQGDWIEADRAALRFETGQLGRARTDKPSVEIE